MSILKFKRPLSMILAAALTLSLAACGQSSAPASSTPDAAASTPAASEPAAPSSAAPDGSDITSWIFEKDPASISGAVRWYMPFKGEAGMDALVEEFNKTYPNIKVELTTYNNNTDGNLSVNTAVMSGQVDVLQSFGLNGTYKRWANDLFVDLTDYVKNENIDLMANWGSDKYKYNDKVYTFPCGGQSFYVAINMTKWKEAGLGDIPKEWTWDEYTAACKAMTKDGVYGGTSYHTQIYFSYPYLQVKGRDLYYGDDGLSSFTDPLIVNALDREIKAEKDGIYYPLMKYRSENLQTQNVYLNGTTASCIIMNLARFLRDTETYPVDWVTAFAPYPVEEKGQTNYMSGVVPYSHAGITTGAQDEKAAWAFLKFLSTYGSKYLTIAGHQSTWKDTDAGDLTALIFGSKEDAAKLIDVESFERVVGNNSNPAFSESIVTAYSDITTSFNTNTVSALEGKMTAEEAMAATKKEADEAIKKETGK